MKTIISTYKCGHTCTTIFTRGCSKHEEKMLQRRIGGELCSKCVNLAQRAEHLLLAGAQQ